jgi:hypothetical protein
MWHVFKFFFVWFWLGLTVALLVFYFAHLPDPPHPGAVHAAAYNWNAVYRVSLLAWGGAFFTSIPAYFIARPKSQRNCESTDPHPN